MSIDPQDFPARLEQLRDLKRAYKKAEQASKEAKAAMDLYQHELFQDMREADITTMRTSAGSFERKTTIYGTVIDKEEFARWCHERGLDDFVQETAVKVRLNEYIRSALDNGEPLPDGTNFYAQEYISVKEGA